LANLGDLQGYSICENSIKLWDKLKNSREKAIFLYYFAFAKCIAEDYTGAQDAVSEINDIARELKDDYLLLKSKTAQTLIYICQLQFESAEPLAEQNIRDAIALKHHTDKAQNLHFYADCSLMRKDYKEAERRYSITTKSLVEIGNIKDAAEEMIGIAFAVSGQGRYIKALRLSGAVEVKFEEFGASFAPAKFWLDWIEKYIGGARKAVGEKAAATYDQEGRQMGFEKAVKYALDFEMD